MMLPSLSNRIRPNGCRSWVGLFALAIFFYLGVSAALAQTQTYTFPPQERIALQLERIHAAEHQHLPDAQQGNLWVDLAAEYQRAAELSQAEDAYNKALHLLRNVPSATADYATALDNLGSMYLTYGHLDESENCRRQALSLREKLGNPLDIALSQEHLADIALARHQFKKAEQLASQAYQVMVSLQDPHRLNMLSTLITLTYAKCSQGKCAEGLADAQQALAIVDKSYAPDSIPVGFALITLGFAEWKTGATQDAEKAMLGGIKILKAEMVPPDPRLSGALSQYRDYLLSMHRKAEAKQIHEQVASLARQSAPSCQSCSVSVYGLSNALR